jgi:hypothetical protein
VANARANHGKRASFEQGRSAADVDLGGGSAKARSESGQIFASSPFSLAARRDFR